MRIANRLAGFPEPQKPPEDGKEETRDHGKIQRPFVNGAHSK